MSRKVDRNLWNEYFKVYDVLNLAIPYQELLDAIVTALEIRAGDIVLDAGCGTGNLAIKMKEKGAKVIGLDICSEALDRYHKKHPDTEKLIHDLKEPLPFPDNYFDKLVLNNVIYTLDKQKRGIIFKEFYRVLKPGGKIVAADPRKEMKSYIIYVDAVKKNKRREGILKTIILVSKMAIPAIKMFHFNTLIVRESVGGDYDFIEETEITELLKHSGFKNISENVLVYSEQSIMNSAVK